MSTRTSNGTIVGRITRTVPQGAVGPQVPGGPSGFALAEADQLDGDLVSALATPPQIPLGQRFEPSPTALALLAQTVPPPLKETSLERFFAAVAEAEVDVLGFQSSRRRAGTVDAARLGRNPLDEATVSLSFP